MNKIVVIGSCAMDLTVIAERRPLSGETLFGNKLNISPGGKGANQAVAAAKLGGDVTMIGCVGKDLYGEMILDNLKKYNVHTEYMAIRENADSGTAHITLAEGDNSILVILGANQTVDRTIIDNAWPTITSSDIVLIQQEIPVDTIEYVLSRCHSEGIPVLLNPAPTASLQSKYRNLATYITPNEHELKDLFLHQSIEKILLSHEGQVLVTLETRGVSFATNGHIVNVPAYIVEAVDTTGAGDTFNGGFAVAIANEKSLQNAIRYGNAAAALSVQKIGAQEGMPTALDVERMMK